MNKWYDFSRKNDPVAYQALAIFDQHMPNLELGDILCFWTKDPNGLALMYESRIKILQDRGVLVLAQPTVNGYTRILEPGVPVYDTLEPIANLLGPGHVRVRFDPIIPGFTAPMDFIRCVKLAQSIGCDRITVNFISGDYTQALDHLIKRVQVECSYPSFTREKVLVNDEEKVRILRLLLLYSEGIKLAVCAESSHLRDLMPELLPAKCADPEWCAQFTYTTMFGIEPYYVKGGHGSRKGCGCVYTKSIQISDTCPHKCVYCYAGKQ